MPSLNAPGPSGSLVLNHNDLMFTVFLPSKARNELQVQTMHNVVSQCACAGVLKWSPWGQKWRYAPFAMTCPCLEPVGALPNHPHLYAIIHPWVKEVWSCTSPHLPGAR